VGPEFDLKSLLREDSFPSDYGQLSPDFLFLPVSILKKQMEQVRDGLTVLMKRVLEEERNVVSKDPDDLGIVRGQLFELEKTHLMLHDRWLFGQELARNLAKCFDEIPRRESKDNSTAAYSKVLLQRLETQVTLSKMLNPSFNTIPSKIRAQHRMVLISSQFFDLDRSLTMLLD